MPTTTNRADELSNDTTSSSSDGLLELQVADFMCLFLDTFPTVAALGQGAVGRPPKGVNKKERQNRKSICEGEKVKSGVISLAKKFKYYVIIAECTRYIAHVEQLSLTLRFVD
ncbi:unnamed protein product [Parnassius apollo]|uniref:(apollo) hypothetical protein n=1 Tax=Parnassius apollo TaxID=110799 RepID=A0A8S3WM83_PARAO|nr:unnamed protein product [Parnassius apollo]